MLVPPMAIRRMEMLIGESAAMRALRTTIARVASVACSITFVGETGSGKEEAARYLHQMSARNRGPFVVIPLQHFDNELAESRLYGHRKGAFTGALDDSAGLFESASNGTVFLDELQRASKTAQALLLRVLDKRGFQRVGSPATVSPDFRLVVATAREPARLVEDDIIDEHLYYWMSMDSVFVPPLRERLDDLELLIQHFVKQSTMHREPDWSPSAVAAMRCYDWPGNVRQLAGVVESALCLDESTITTAAIERILAKQPARTVHPRLYGRPLSKNDRRRTLDQDYARLGSYRAVAEEYRVSEKTIARDIKEARIRKR